MYRQRGLLFGLLTMMILLMINACGMGGSVVAPSGGGPGLKNTTDTTPSVVTPDTKTTEGGTDPKEVVTGRTGDDDLESDDEEAIDDEEIGDDEDSDDEASMDDEESADDEGKDDDGYTADDSSDEEIGDSTEDSIVVSRGEGDKKVDPKTFHEEKDKGGKDGITTTPDTSAGDRRDVTKVRPDHKLDVPMAGEHDDNEEFQYYIKFLKDNAYTINYYSGSFTDRAAKRNVIAVYDQNDKPLFHANVKIGNQVFITYQDGEFLYTPSVYDTKQDVEIEYNGKTYKDSIMPSQYGRSIIKINTKRADLQAIPVDIVFLMDTTGSMQDEIDKLRDTLFSIYNAFNTKTLGNIKMRFGLVLYRDKGDEYVTRKYELTDDKEKFANILLDDEKVRAGGGGDTPEDLVSGLDETIKMNWNSSAIKMVFLITDAPSHKDNWKVLENRIDQMILKQIKFYSIGASGLDLEGELELRMTSQMTKGKFIFLTYGETGESSGSATVDDPGKVSHHTGANYQSRTLDSIIINNVTREIYFQSDQKIVAQAQKDFDYQTMEDIVKIRVDNLMQQLIVQSKGLIGSKKTVLILPPIVEDEKLKPMSVYVKDISEKMMTDSKMLAVVDRENLDEIMKEIKLKLSGVASGADDIQEMVGADTIIAGKLYFVSSSCILSIKLIDAANSKVIASAMVKI